MKRAILMSAWLVLLLGLFACAAATEDTPTWREEYDLGVRYLSEGDYEEAVIAFTAAIGIDSKQSPALVGRGDAYAALAEQELEGSVALTLWEKAAADYACAFELGEAQAGEKLEESREILRRLQAGEDTRLLLETLYARFENDDIEGAKALMRQADYQELSASASEVPRYYDCGDGLGLAAYPDNFYYYGQWENGLRSGQGIWICAIFEEGNSDLESYLYEGEWANDRPNGEGRIVSSNYPDQVELGATVETEITGTFANGLFHGTIYLVGYMNDGSTHIWSPITAVDGIYQQMENIPAGVRSREYYKTNVSSGKYVVAIDQQNGFSDLWSYGTINCVRGFDNRPT